MDHITNNNNNNNSWLSFSLSPYLAMEQDQHNMTPHHHHQITSSSTTAAATTSIANTNTSHLNQVYNSASRGDHGHHHHHHQQILSPPPHTPSSSDHISGYHPHPSFTSQMLEIASLRPSLSNSRSNSGHQNPTSNLAMMGAALTNPNHNAGGWQFKGELMEASHDYSGTLFSNNATNGDTINNTKYIARFNGGNNSRSNGDGDDDNDEQVRVMSSSPNVMMMMTMASGGGGGGPNVEEGGPKLEDFLGCGNTFSDYNHHDGGHHHHLNPNLTANPHPNPNSNPSPKYHLNPNPNPSPNPHLNPNPNPSDHLNPNHAPHHGHVIPPIFYQGSRDDHVGITSNNTIAHSSRPPKTEHNHIENHNHNNSFNALLDMPPPHLHHHHHHHHLNHTQNHQHNGHGNYHLLNDPLKDHNSQHYKFYPFDPSTQNKSLTLLQMQEEAHHNHHVMLDNRDHDDTIVGFKSALKTWLGHSGGEKLDEFSKGVMKESSGVNLQQSLSLSMNPCLLPHGGVNTNASGIIATNPSGIMGTNPGGFHTNPGIVSATSPTEGANMVEHHVMASDGTVRQDSRKRGSSNKAAVSKAHAPRKSLDTFGQRTSQYRGVTRHRWTGRYEAHLWDNSCRKEGQTRKGRQVYLGGYDKEEKAARAYDLAALKYWGPTTHTNFPTSTYKDELEEMKNMTRQEYVASLRRKSSGFSRGASIYRGVTRHHQQGRWQARIGRVAGNKDLYLGTFSTQEEAAEAYDIAAIKFRGIHAVTNFETTRYDVPKICSSNTLLVGEEARRKVETKHNDIFQEGIEEQNVGEGEEENSTKEGSRRKTKGKKESQQLMMKEDEEGERNQMKLISLAANDDDDDPLIDDDNAAQGLANSPGEILASVPSLSTGSSSSGLVCPPPQLCPNVNGLLLLHENAESNNHPMMMMMMMGSPENSMSEVDDGSPKEMLTIPGDYTKALELADNEHHHEEEEADNEYHHRGVAVPWMLNDSNLQQPQQQQQQQQPQQPQPQPQQQSVACVRGGGGGHHLLQPMFAAWNDA